MRMSDWSSDVCSSDLIAPSILPYVCTRSRRTLGLVPARRWPLRLADADVRHRHASLGELDLFGMECLARQVKVDAVTAIRNKCAVDRRRPGEGACETINVFLIVGPKIVLDSLTVVNRHADMRADFGKFGWP